MNSKVTFDGAPEPGVINFGVGQPSADLLPVELVQAASERFFQSAIPIELNYGEMQGDIRFRESLAGFLSEAYGRPADPDQLMLSGGNSQALDFICQRFTRPGDTVFVEEPSYFLAFQILRDHGLDVVGIPLDGRGMDMAAFERALGNYRPRLVYTIPSFHNPTGQTLDEERRERLAELSLEHDFLIAADEVYQLLYCYAEPPPPLGCLAGRGNVLSMGSFSKILAPGMRLGWIQTNPRLLERLLSSGVLNSGGNFNHFSSHIVRQAMEHGLLAEFIPRLRLAYRARLEAMQQGLEAHFKGLATWVRPDGGYFFWLELPREMDAVEIRSRAGAAGTGFQPGGNFSSAGRLRNCLRLSFAHYGVEDIHEGLGRLADLIKS